MPSRDDKHQESTVSVVEHQASATTPHHNRFTALFPGPPGRAGARRELLNFRVRGKINKGRHTDHLAGRHSIRTNQYPPPPSPHFLQARRPSCLPTNSVKALKAVHQLLRVPATSAQTNCSSLLIIMAMHGQGVGSGSILCLKCHKQCGGVD